MFGEDKTIVYDFLKETLPLNKWWTLWKVGIFLPKLL